MYVVYVLKSMSFEKAYVGMTTDINRRLKEHDSKKHSYTKRFVPWKIIHIENFTSGTEARKREKYFKSASGRNFLKKNVF